jgi:transcription elongation factor Elf1
MPYDPHGTDEEPLEPGQNVGKKRSFKDFDCPSCSANNPYEDGFADGDEVICYYCGAEFKARVNDEGQLRLREL